MASEIQVYSNPDRVVYFVVRNLSAQVYRPSTPGFVTFVDANQSDYAISTTEQGTSSGYYVGNFPALAAGIYHIMAYERLGGSPAVSDTVVAQGTINWSGTVEIFEKSTYDAATSGLGYSLTAASQAATAAANSTNAANAAALAQTAAEDAKTSADAALAGINNIDEAVVNRLMDESIDGVRYESLMELLMAVLSGRATVSIDSGSGNTVVVYKKRGGAAKVTIVHDSIGNRSSSTINS